MNYIVPSENILYFLSIRDGQVNMGSPNDMIRNFQLLENRGLLYDGLEMYLKLHTLRDNNQFPAWFYDKASALNYKTLHIGGDTPDFLFTLTNVEQKLSLLSEMLERLDIRALIIHAHHLKDHRLYIKNLFARLLPKTEILVENNGLDNTWGSSINGLMEIFHDCPEFKLCLDICHLKETGNFSLTELISMPEIRDRIRQVHISFSPVKAGEDLYAKHGYPEYNPNHALFSIIKEPLSEKTKKIISQYPIVIEGVMVREDKNFDFFKKEVEILTGE